MTKNSRQLIMFSLAAHGVGISGGDRIFAEFARRWSKTIKTTIYVWTEGYHMCQRMELTDTNIQFKVSRMFPWSKMGFLINYFARIIEGIRLGLTINLPRDRKTLVYSSSEFWMDVFPCFILKMRKKNIKWVATWYQTAPNPLKGYSEIAREKTYKLNSLLYWLAQLPSKYLIASSADLILVNNEDEKERFPQKNKIGAVIPVIGAVDTEKIDVFKKTNKIKKHAYQAVFQGRFHPQKGIVEIIKIWKTVVQKLPQAKLVMIGDGGLMAEAKALIAKLNLEKNIALKGFMFDGKEKYTTFAESAIVVHPALYDSGGMASAEAMAFGLPCVGFDLMAYKSYYPLGMVKTKNEHEFSQAIIHLFTKSSYYKKIANEARELIYKKYSWNKRASEILEKINTL